MKSFAILSIAVLILAGIAKAQEYEVEWSYQADGVYRAVMLGDESKHWIDLDGDVSIIPPTDFNGDNCLDIILFRDGEPPIVSVISGESHQELYRFSGLPNGPLNLDNDLSPEFILIDEDNSIFSVCSGTTGEVEWRSGNIDGIREYSVPFADIDGDERMEFAITAVADSVGIVYIYGFPGRGDGVVGDNPPLPSQSKLTSGPNPFNGNTNIRFTSLQPNVGNITLTDISGREIAFRRDYPLRAGENIIPLSSLTPLYSSLPAGSYFVRVVSDDKIETINLTKLP